MTATKEKIAVRQISVRVPEPIYKDIEGMSRSMGTVGAAYPAKVLLFAAHAARYGKSGDHELDQIVAATCLLRAAEFDSSITARVLGISEPLAERIWAAWKAERR